MQIILIIFIFCIVLFFYTHVFFHLKTSNDLEVYEIEQPSKEKLEEICDLRQPIVFNYSNDRLFESCIKESIKKNYGAFDINIRDVKDTNDDEDMIYLPITYINCINALEEDNYSKYITENNYDFLEETGLIKCYKHNDYLLRPYMVSNCMYDYLSGSKNSTSPFRYDINYRNYYFVTEGEIIIKLAPPKSSKYLYENKDYDNFEFKSSVDPWNVDDKYKADFDKIKCLELKLTKGNIIHIPSYWWYSIKFINNASVCSFKYNSYMSTISNLPRILMMYLQKQNIKRDVLNKMYIKE